MKSHEFYHKYANLPLPTRDNKINVDGAELSLNQVYFEIHAIDDKIRNDIIRKEHLISAFERHFNKR